MPSSAWKKDVCRSEEHTSELQSLTNLVCRLLLEKNHDSKYGDPARRSHRLARRLYETPRRRERTARRTRPRSRRRRGPDRTREFSFFFNGRATPRYLHPSPPRPSAV